MGCTDSPSKALHQWCTPSASPRGSVTSYLIYADVRSHIPMTHRNDTADGQGSEFSLRVYSKGSGETHLSGDGDGKFAELMTILQKCP